MVKEDSEWKGAWAGLQLVGELSLLLLPGLMQ